MANEIRAHIKVVQHPNPQRRSFHVTREVGDIDHSMYRFGKKNSLSGLNKNPGEDAKMLAKRLSELPGVIDGYLQQYEVSVGIGDAFSWRDIGPLVLGEIIHNIFPEVDGQSLEVSVSIGWGYRVRPNGMVGFMCGEDDGHRIRYQDTVDHKPVEVNLGTRPTLDIEYMLDENALTAAKQQAARETVFE